MAVDTYGSKGEPQFTDAGAPDLAVDDNAVSKYAADYGNYRVGTTSQRNADTVAGRVWQGLQWLDTTDQRLYTYSNGWKFGAGNVPWAQAIRTVNGDSETYPSVTLVGIHSVSIANAPTGVYEWAFSVSLSSTVTTSGEVHVRSNGNEVNGSPYASDRSANIRTVLTPSGFISHSAGNLTVEFLDFIASGTGRFHGKAAGTLRFVSAA
jgi:hypothetical protein